MLEHAESASALSWLDGALARFAADNGDLAPRTRALLDSIVAEPVRHARMINTLSLLEHMGSHKIMATQHSAAIDQATLKHVAEEAHHAFFMKRQAEKTAERPLEYVADDLLAPCSARMYFQRLEGATVRALDAPQRSETDGLQREVRFPVSYETNELTLEIAAGEPGYLVVNDTHLSGWTATVGGEPATIHRANLFQRMVQVPAEAVTVRFRYTTPGFVPGIVLSVLSLGVVLVLLGLRVASRRRPPRAEDAV